MCACTLNYQLWLKIKTCFLIFRFIFRTNYNLLFLFLFYLFTFFFCYGLFRNKQAGATLYAQLEIWKAACCDAQQIYFDGCNAMVPLPNNINSLNNVQSWNSPMECDSVDESFKNGKCF